MIQPTPSHRAFAALLVACTGIGIAAFADKDTPPPRTTTQHRDATTAATGPGASPPSISGASGVDTQAEAVPAGVDRLQPGHDSPHAAVKEAAKSQDVTSAGTKPASATLPHWLTYAEWVQAPHNRPVVMYWHRLNCGPCRVWERTVLDHPAVQDFLAAKFDCVEIDGATAMQIFGVRSTPSVIVGRRGRWELYQGSNLPRDPDHFVALLEL